MWNYRQEPVASTLQDSMKKASVTINFVEDISNDQWRDDDRSRSTQARWTLHNTTWAISRENLYDIKYKR